MANETDQRDEAEAEVLDVAATRPQLVPFVGIPLGLANILLVGSFAIANLFHATILGIGAGCILAGFASLLVRRDYNGVRIFGIWIRLCALWLSASRMGGATACHFPQHRRRRFKATAYRGMRTSDAF
jgi:type IV secretory pathway VirB3-like protein